MFAITNPFHGCDNTFFGTAQIFFLKEGFCVADEIEAIKSYCLITSRVIWRTKLYRWSMPTSDEKTRYNRHKVENLEISCYCTSFVYIFKFHISSIFTCIRLTRRKWNKSNRRRGECEDVVKYIHAFVDRLGLRALQQNAKRREELEE